MIHQFCSLLFPHEFLIKRANLHLLTCRKDIRIKQQDAFTVVPDGRGIFSCQRTERKLLSERLTKRSQMLVSQTGHIDAARPRRQKSANFVRRKYLPIPRCFLCFCTHNAYDCPPQN